FVGPATISKERVIANMRTKVGKYYVPEAVDEDVRNLYATGSISNVRIEPQKVADGVKVIVVIQTKATVSEVVFQGVTQFKVSHIRKDMKVKPGSVLDEADMEVDRQKLLDMYSDHGYANTTVTYKVDMNPDTGAAKVTYIVNEAQKMAITQIEFNGNTHFKTKELRKAIKSRTRNILSFITKDGRVDTDKMDEDVSDLHDFYQDHGYLDVTIKGPDVVPLQKDRVKLVYEINEGPIYHVHSVSIDGASVFTPDQVRAVVKLKEGGIFSPKQMDDDKTAIEKLYGGRGYVDLHIDTPTSITGDHLVDVTFHLDEGSQSYIEHINISGNTRTKDKVIRREIQVHPGDLYNTNLVDVSKARLENLKYFKKVDTYPSDTNVPGRKDLNVIVEEERTGSFNFGAGFSSIDSLSGFVEVQQTNFDLFHPWDFTGGGERFRARIQAGTERKDAVLSLTEPWFMDHQLAVGGELFFHDDTYSSDVYDTRNYGLDLNIRKALTPFTSIRADYRIEEFTIYGLSGYGFYSQPILNAQGNYWKSSISTTLSYDTRDNLFLPRRGERVDFSIITSGLGGNVKDYGFDLNASKYIHLPGDTILSFTGEVSTVAGYGGHTVPIFDRLFLGGANNLRGFKYRDVGPKDQFGDPIGGDTLARITAEYTFPVVERVRGAVFYDTGFVNSGNYSFSTSNLNSDIGLGVRLDLPIVGPVRLDYGYPIQEDSFSSHSGHFQVNLGYQF
ncbi:MAG TPA: outer membrane protein assembly factor BamA, partial [Chthoniobacteraceae bacterium]|nr:outer membrane protein assembly factor BamA [Chthoniobacteraceae bacterium]